jgi:hypothetical protein
METGEDVAVPTVHNVLGIKPIARYVSDDSGKLWGLWQHWDKTRGI